LKSANSSFITSKCHQQTISRKVSFSGIGIHTGQLVDLSFCPAPENTGIIFKRVDLPNHPEIKACVENIKDTARSTTIGVGNVFVHTVEHVLAALRAYNIHNVMIELSNIEPPIGNGSSDVFVKMIEEAGIQEQQALLPVYGLKEPIYWSDKEIHIVALPYPGYRISYTLSYPENKFLKAQYYTGEISPVTFKNEIAPCRTFALYHEISFLMDAGLIKGGSLDNAVVIQKDAIISKEGLFFDNEMARHKVLDLIGDLSLSGIYFQAHIIAIRSGHPSHAVITKKIRDYFMENTHAA
jgi:UDP-3-O-[3-hydroxymyristoyl] N-acetylglucosamine deacetylase